MSNPDMTNALKALVQARLKPGEQITSFSVKVVPEGEGTGSAGAGVGSAAAESRAGVGAGADTGAGAGAGAPKEQGAAQSVQQQQPQIVRNQSLQELSESEGETDDEAAGPNDAEIDSHAEDIPAFPFDVRAQAKFFALHLVNMPRGYASLDTSRMTALYFALNALDLMRVLDATLAKIQLTKQDIINWVYSMQVHPDPHHPHDYSRCGFRGSAHIGVPLSRAPVAAPAAAADGAAAAASTSSPATASSSAADAPKSTTSSSSASCCASSSSSSSSSASSSSSSSSSAAAGCSLFFHRASSFADYPFDCAHLAMTYSALCVLRILGDDLSGVNKAAVIGALKHLQVPGTGCFKPTAEDEADMRFLFCACAISALLGDWSGVDKDAAVKYIQSCQSYDGGIALVPGNEGHGGSTYVAVASLALMGRFQDLPRPLALLRWCLSNQGNGFRGRPNKPRDSCYSFWMGAALEMMGAYHMTNAPANRVFNLRCSSEHGGFAKHPNIQPEILHSYYGVAGLSLMNLDRIPAAAAASASAAASSAPSSASASASAASSSSSSDSGSAAAASATSKTKRFFRRLDPALGISLRALGSGRGGGKKNCAALASSTSSSSSGSSDSSSSSSAEEKRTVAGGTAADDDDDDDDEDSIVVRPPLLPAAFFETGTMPEQSAATATQLS